MLSPSESPPSVQQIGDPRTPLSRLTSFLDSLPTPTARTRMIAQLSRVLLLHCAQSQRYNCSHILPSDSLTNIAVNLIDSVAEGAGFSLKNEWEEDWSPDPILTDAVGSSSKQGEAGKTQSRTVRILKTLRDVTAKECGVFFHWRGLKLFGRPQVVPPDQGIWKLTRGLFKRLELC